MWCQGNSPKDLRHQNYNNLLWIPIRIHFKRSISFTKYWSPRQLIDFECRMSNFEYLLWFFSHFVCLQRAAANIQNSKFDMSKSLSCRGQKINVYDSSSIWSNSEYRIFVLTFQVRLPEENKYSEFKIQISTVQIDKLPRS